MNTKYCLYRVHWKRGKENNIYPITDDLFDYNTAMQIAQAFCEQGCYAFVETHFTTPEYYMQFNTPDNAIPHKSIINYIQENLKI